jgi:hypothetical protein
MVVGEARRKLLTFRGAKTVILPQLLREDAMSKALDYIKAALQIAFSLVVLAIVLLNFHGLHVALQKFLERAGSVSSIKVLGVEIDMDAAESALSAADAKRAFFHVENLTGAEKRRVVALIQSLEGKEFVRLMYVGQRSRLHRPKCAMMWRSIMNCATRV